MEQKGVVVVRCPRAVFSSTFFVLLLLVSSEWAIYFSVFLFYLSMKRAVDEAYKGGWNEGMGGRVQGKDAWREHLKVFKLETVV